MYTLYYINSTYTHTHNLVRTSGTDRKTKPRNMCKRWEMKKYIEEKITIEHLIEFYSGNSATLR